MVEVDFSDLAEAEAWFEGQSPEVRSVMASRAALRVAANLGLYDGKGADKLVLIALRYTLRAASHGMGQYPDATWHVQAAHSPRSAALSAAAGAANSAISARSARSAALSTNFSAQSVALSAHAALSATIWDSQRLDDDLNSERLWAGAAVPDALQIQHTTFLTHLRKNTDWDFFRSWYEQMWEGTFTD